MQSKQLFLATAAIVMLMAAQAGAAYIMPGAIGNDGSNGFDGTVTATATSFTNGAFGVPRDPMEVVNGSELYAPGEHIANSYGDPGSWLSGNGDTTGYFAIDLGASYDLASMRFWNFNTNSSTRNNRGVQTADVYVATVATPTDYDFANNSEWTLLLDDEAFGKATGEDTYAGEVHALNVTARHVALDIQSNHGDSSYTGISEMQFFEVPEPATLGLLAVGGLALIRRRRR